ncbi:MAG: hypothetical protein IKZ21_07390, partial [Clostridia bacterium]|nr:hypothetical protein [Clostridia bacterium]
CLSLMEYLLSADWVFSKLFGVDKSDIGEAPPYEYGPIVPHRPADYKKKPTFPLENTLLNMA